MNLWDKKEILGNGKLLRRAIEADRISSIILYGPPGSGKTTIAKIIAENTAKYFYQLNAVTSGVNDLRDVIKKAKELRSYYNKGAIMFIDEIHRFNKKSAGCDASLCGRWYSNSYWRYY